RQPRSPGPGPGPPAPRRPLAPRDERTGPGGHVGGELPAPGPLRLPGAHPHALGLTDTCARAHRTHVRYRAGMGWRNPAVPWSELERRLSDAHTSVPPGDGGYSPAWSRRRGSYVPVVRRRARAATPWAELHAHS